MGIVEEEELLEDMHAEPLADMDARHRAWGRGCEVTVFLDDEGLELAEIYQK